MCSICNGNVIIKHDDVMYLINTFNNCEECSRKSILIKFYVMKVLTCILQSGQFPQLIIQKNIMDSILNELQYEVFPEFHQQIFIFLINASKFSINIYIHLLI